MTIKDLSTTTSKQCETCGVKHWDIGCECKKCREYAKEQEERRQRKAREARYGKISDFI